MINWNLSSLISFIQMLLWLRCPQAGSLLNTLPCMPLSSLNTITTLPHASTAPHQRPSLHSHGDGH